MFLLVMLRTFIWTGSKRVTNFFQTRRFLVLGGAASGKSTYGEQIVKQTGRQCVYLATARVYDAEMREKVETHITMRGSGWTTIEEPVDVPGILASRSSDEVVLVDCATMWLTNIMLDGLDLKSEQDRLFAALDTAACTIVVVSNEVGLGIVPDSRLGRDFRNAQGRLNARLAAACDTVAMVTAGLPRALKGQLPE